MIVNLIIIMNMCLLFCCDDYSWADGECGLLLFFESVRIIDTLYGNQKAVKYIVCRIVKSIIKLKCCARRHFHLQVMS